MNHIILILFYICSVFELDEMIQVGVTRIIIETDDGSYAHIWISKDFVDKNVDSRIFAALHQKFGEKNEYKIPKR